MSTIDGAEVANAPRGGASGTLRRSAIRGGGVLIGCRWAAQLLSWAVTLGVARLLGPQDYGVMTGALMLLGLGDLLAEAGIGRALVQKESVTDADHAQGFTVSLLLALACYGLVLAGTLPTARFLRIPELRLVLPVMGTVILMMPFRTISLGILDRRLELVRQGQVSLLVTALQSITVLALAVVGAGYWALVVGAVVSRVVETVCLGVLAGWRPRLAVPGRAAWLLLRFGVPLSSGGLLWYAYSNSDFAVVGRLAGPVALGYYSLAYQLMSVPGQKVTSNINQIAFPVFCRLRTDPERLRDWYLRLTALLCFILLPVMGGAALLARDGIETLFGAKWLPAALPFQLLSVVGVFTLFSASLIPLLNALGRPGVALRYTAACSLVFPISFTVAGTSHGMIGVCVAWAVVFPVMVGLLIHFTRELTGAGLLSVLRAQVPVLRAGVVMAAAVVVALRTVPGGSVPAGARLAATVGVGAAAYAGCLWLTAQETVLADVRTIWREMKGKSSSN